MLQTSTIEMDLRKESNFIWNPVDIGYHFAWKRKTEIQQCCSDHRNKGSKLMQNAGEVDCLPSGNDKRLITATQRIILVTFHSRSRAQVLDNGPNVQRVPVVRTITAILDWWCHVFRTYSMVARSEQTITTMTTMRGPLQRELEPLPSAEHGWNSMSQSAHSSL